MTAPLPPNENERLLALQRYGILDTEPEKLLDDITLLAARICGTPMASITLVDRHRQWFKSKIGITDSETPRDLAFCAYTILQTDLMIVEDAWDDPRFAANALVTGSPNIRFYAGSSLITPDGHALGTLCVIDQQPRILDEEQKEALCALSRQVVAQFELRRSLAESRMTVARLEQAEASLHNSVAEFRVLAEAMPQIVWVTRPDGWHTHFNQRWMDYTGLTLEESLGHGWLPPFHPEDQPVAAKLWAAANASGDPYEIEYRLRGADGNYRWMLGRALPLRSASGQIVKWFGTCTDIHVVKMAELEAQRTSQEIERLNADLEGRVARRTEALFAATVEAERANRAKGEFLSRMSHELRTPMNAILGFAQVLETEESLTADQRDSVDQILKGGTHLLGLINEVLDITSIDAGKMTISTEPVALKELLEESVSLLRPMAAQLGIQLTVIPSELAEPYALADRQRLKQVLLNLLGNALKYNRPNGSVTIRCTAGGPVDASPTTLRLSVTDTGRGLSEDQLSRLFQPFERLGAEDARVEGTGLGLVLAKRMVEHMSGTLGVESVVGEGSTFWVELRRAEAPAILEEPSSNAIAPPEIEVAAEKRRVLYVEDNPANVRLITRILARRPGIELLCAETGALGLKLAREHCPDLILLDLHLPDSDGDQVLTELRADPRCRNIPVIMLTADAQPRTREQLLAAGARSFITKPIEVRMLLAAIDQFITPA